MGIRPEDDIWAGANTSPDDYETPTGEDDEEEVVLEPLRPCKHCGELTRRGWCSPSCHRAEDGDQW